MAQHIIKITKNRGVKQTATDRPFDERNEDVKNILLLKAVPSIPNVPMSICVYLFACACVCVCVCVCVCARGTNVVKAPKSNGLNSVLGSVIPSCWSESVLECETMSLSHSPHLKKKNENHVLDCSSSLGIN